MSRLRVLGNLDFGDTAKPQNVAPPSAGDDAATKSYVDNAVAGVAGEDGADGKSAYELWLDQGNTGTLQGFLDSLVGAPGADGAPGATGAAGPAGADGEDGRTVLNGTGAPAANVGLNGDFYIDTAAWTIYGPKTAGVWGAGTSILGITEPAWFYGDGSDGDATISTNSTINVNRSYNNLTVADGVSVTLGGNVLQVRGTLTMGAGSRIHRDGIAAIANTGGGARSASVYGRGGAGGNGNSPGTNVSDAFGGAGGNGGNAGSSPGALGGTVTAPTAASGGTQSRSNIWSLTSGLVLGSTSKFAGGAGGGGGAGTTSSAGGGGGGGGVVVVFARKIVVSSGTANISADGGAGGAAPSGPAGGGGGGGGGVCVVVSANDKPSTLTVSANGGAGGAPGGNGGVGAGGTAGYAAFYKWQS